MSDYPDIEKHCPAWAFEPGDQPRILEYDDLNDLPPRLRPWFLRGLAQFVRAVCREPWMKDLIRAVVREMDRGEMGEIRREEPPIVSTPPGSSAGSPDKIEICSKCGCIITDELSPASCWCGVKVEAKPDLAERLAREAEETMRDLDGLSADEGWAAYILRPYFQRLERYISNKIVKIETIDQAIRELLSEVNCRREHGASGGEHLEYIEGRLEKILRAVRGGGMKARMIKLKNRRVYARLWDDGTVEYAMKRLEGRKVKTTGIRLTPQAILAMFRLGLDLGALDKYVDQFSKSTVKPTEAQGGEE